MEENDSNMVRFRLVFDDRHLLDKSLRSQGLRRCWFLLKPGISTIGELVTHISESFGLHDRIVLFMDDFVLPSFESTSIITDKDIITVKKKEAKQKDICKPCDGQSLMQDSQIARVHDLPFSNDLLSDDKSQRNSQDSGSSDKEKMISFTETAVDLDPPVGLAKRKRKHSRKLLGSNDQSAENNHDHEFEPSNSSDVIKNDVPKKQASTQMIHHNSDGEECAAPSADQSGYIRIQPREYNTQQVDEAQPLLFDGSCSMNGTNMNKEKKFPQTTDNDRCINIDDAPVGDGLLPLPNPKVMFSTNNITRPPKQIVHFESLLPLRRLPVKGDTLVYRYAEPSSSAYPGLSSPQVGKVSSFDYRSLQITLHPVPGYEVLLENPNGAVVQQNASRAKEHESIEIEYSSLIDVRLLKTYDSEAAACQKDSTMKDNWEEALAKENENELNALPAEQNNDWSQWIPNKSATLTSSSCKQPNAPIAGSKTNLMDVHVGRNNGRTNWAPNRGGKTWNTSRNNTNRSLSRHLTNWNPSSCTAIDNTITTLPWSYRATGLPAPWDPRQNKSFPPGGNSYSSPGKQ